MSISMGSNLVVADNSGAKVVRCVKVLGGAKRMTAVVGDTIVVSVKVAIPGAQCKKKSVQIGVIVRTRAIKYRSDGSSVSFGDNAVVIINKQGEPIGSRVFGAVAHELRRGGFLKIISLAKEIL